MKPHRTDGVSLSFGLIFLLVALWWALSRMMTIHLPAVGWMVAGGLIMFGVIGLLGAIRTGRRTPPVQATATVEPQPAEPAIPGDLPPEMHASIVQELLDDPAERFRKEHPDQADQPRSN
ncbi:phage holin family protein [Actinoplanes sp. NPDC026619]|uniref:phage holin family protein n=1 Tax=Actinoplanes sp. NPDC026619 TaxID=3155798 RepID=UPI0033FEE396